MTHLYPHSPACLMHASHVSTSLRRTITLRVGIRAEVAVCAPPPPQQQQRLAGAAGAMPPPPVLRPYLALLPLEEPAVVVQHLPPDACPLLVRLLHCASPLRSLEQLADETGIEMPVLFGMAQHLQLWGKVRVIQSVTQESVFCVHPDAWLRTDDEFERIFGIVEPGYAMVLGLFSSAQRFGSVIRAAEEIQVPKRRLVQMTLYLLQREVIHQLHTYTCAYCFAEPRAPNDADRSAAAEAARSRCRLFRRLRPLFHGEHHLEEIMWQERLSRDVVADLLRTYDEHLITIVTQGDGFSRGRMDVDYQ